MAVSRERISQWPVTAAWYHGTPFGVAGAQRTILSTGEEVGAAGLVHSAGGDVIATMALGPSLAVTAKPTHTPACPVIHTMPPRNVYTCESGSVCRSNVGKSHKRE